MWDNYFVRIRIAKQRVYYFDKYHEAYKFYKNKINKLNRYSKSEEEVYIQLGYFDSYYDFTNNDDYYLLFAQYI